MMNARSGVACADKERVGGAGPVSAVKARPRERGMVLGLAVIIVTFVFIITVPFATKLSTRRRVTEKTFDSLTALDLAEAGVERAIWEMNFGNISSWSGSSTQRTLAISGMTTSNGTVAGNIAITVANPATANPVVTSTGTAPFEGPNSVTRTVQVVLQSGGAPALFSYGLFGNDGVSLSNNADVDSYDSRNGNYGGANLTHHGNIGTNAISNGAIHLNNNALIDGSALVGAGGNPATAISLDNNATITGSKSSLSQPKELPSVPVPINLTNRGDVSIGNNGSLTITQSGQYGNFSASNNATITVDGDVTLYFANSFSLSNNVQFKIAVGRTVSLYFGGAWNLSNNVSINNLSKDPSKLMMLGTDTFNGWQTFSNNTATYAGMYFPKASIYLSNNADIYGSLVCGGINQNNNGGLHYDEALGAVNLGLGTGSSAYTVKSWQQKFN